MFTLTEPPLHGVQVFPDAIRGNAEVLSARANGEFVADVRGDGYGHGVLESALACVQGGAVGLRVSYVGDAAVLRRAGIRVPVFAAFESAGLTASELDVKVDASAAATAPAELYGLSADPELLPAMRVTATVVATKTIDAGDGVSYGYTYRAARRTRLAMVGIGYADGVDRHAGNSGAMLLAGEMRTIAGRVAMNVLMLDLGGDDVPIGSEAVLFGHLDEPSARDWAAAIGILPEQATAVFGSKVRR